MKRAPIGEGTDEGTTLKKGFLMKNFLDEINCRREDSYLFKKDSFWERIPKWKRLGVALRNPLSSKMNLIQTSSSPHTFERF